MRHSTPQYPSVRYGAKQHLTNSPKPWCAAALQTSTDDELRMASESAKCAGATDGACDAVPIHPILCRRAMLRVRVQGTAARRLLCASVHSCVRSWRRSGRAALTRRSKSRVRPPQLQRCKSAPAAARAAALPCSSQQAPTCSHAVQAVLRATVGLRANHMLLASCDGARNMQQRFGAGSIFKASTDAAQALAVAPASDHSLLSQALPLTTAPLPLATAPLPLAISLRLTRNCRRAAHQDSPRHSRVRLAVQRC